MKFRRKKEVREALCESAAVRSRGPKPMVEPLKLWQRLGHASYRDWVLAAQKARRRETVKVVGAGLYRGNFGRHGDNGAAAMAACERRS